MTAQLLKMIYDSNLLLIKILNTREVSSLEVATNLSIMSNILLVILSLHITSFLVFRSSTQVHSFLTLQVFN